MRTRNIYEPYIGQQWTAPDSKQFEITDLVITEDDAWVNYKNCQTGQDYNCRLEAFRTRFSPVAE